MDDRGYRLPPDQDATVTFESKPATDGGLTSNPPNVKRKAVGSRERSYDANEDATDPRMTTADAEIRHGGRRYGGGCPNRAGTLNRCAGADSRCASRKSPEQESCSTDGGDNSALHPDENRGPLLADD